MSVAVETRLDVNGYRDPKERERERLARLRELEEGAGFGRVDFGGGAKSARQCGYRKEGGVYAEVPTSPYGKPVEFFLACPPVPIDAQEYGLANVGVKIIDVPETCLTCEGGGRTILSRGREHPALLDASYSSGIVGTCSVCGGSGQVPVAHVFDIVGGEYYPNVADFIEEARRLGISRRLELSGGGVTPCGTCAGVGTLEEGAKTCETCKGEGTVKAPNQYARLTSRSRLILLHKRAVINNPLDYLRAFGELELERLANAECPKYHPQHKAERIAPEAWTLQNVPPGCAALWWHDLEGAEIIPERSFSADACSGVGDGCGDGAQDSGRFVERKLAAGCYRGYSRPEEIKPDYALGIFAVFPLVRLVVIDPEGQYGDKVDKVSAAQLDVGVEDC